MKLYFDANALIRAVEADDVAAAKLRTIIDLSEDGGCAIVTSELSLAETTVGPLKALADNPGNPEALARERLYRSFAESQTGLRMIAIDRNVLLRAAAIRASRPALKLPDAIHLATETLAGCDVLVSGDTRLRSAALTMNERKGAVCSLEDTDLGALNFRLGIA